MILGPVLRLVDTHQTQSQRFVERSKIMTTRRRTWKQFHQQRSCHFHGDGVIKVHKTRLIWEAERKQLIGRTCSSEPAFYMEYWPIKKNYQDSSICNHSFRITKRRLARWFGRSTACWKMMKHFLWYDIHKRRYIGIADCRLETRNFWTGIAHEGSECEPQISGGPNCPEYDAENAFFGFKSLIDSQ